MNGPASGFLCRGVSIHEQKIVHCVPGGFVWVLGNIPSVNEYILV